MARSDEVLLVRHGETDDNAALRFQGRRDPPLNATGRAQAHDLALALRHEGIVTLYSSPLRRAHETAVVIGAELGLEPILDERFCEADCGDWSGMLYAEVIEGHAGAFDAWRAADPSFRFPGGESVAEQTARVTDALADVRAAGGLPALVVCHGGTIRAARGMRVPTDIVANCEVHRLSGTAAGAT